MTGDQVNILGMSREELRSFVAGLGERPYRGDQLYQWLYAKGATGFDVMTDCGRAFRETLHARARIGGVVHVKNQLSPADGTTKFLFALSDGLQIESVLIPPSSSFEGDDPGEDESRSSRERLTLCVSTQVGCPLDCAFCATGTMGFLRNLTPGEIIDQVLTVRRMTGRTITNVVFMGMGEPMLNYDAVIRAGMLMTDGAGIAARRITVSTAGWVEGIRRMADEPTRMKLAVSLHSAVPATREKLMPVTRRFPLEALRDALHYYYTRTKVRVTYEYIFFDGVNDTPHEVRRLIAFARAIPCKINVIPYHAIGFAGPEGLGATLRPSPRMEEIVEELRQANLTVIVRSSAGEDIAAACGQLAVQGLRRSRSGHAARNSAAR
jgi:23S rRNA (adenine2503-C2)-methyltransferase